MDFHEPSGSLQRLVIFTFLITFILTIPQTLQAGVTGKLSGKLSRSDTGEAIVGASIQIDGTNFGSISDNLGRFAILNIPPGTYKLRVSFIGFETILLDDVQVGVDLTTWFDFNMKTSILEGQEVIVHSDKDIIEKDLAGTRAVVTQEQFDALPITKISQALTLQSGVAASGDYLYIRGGRSNQVAFLIDGVYVQDPFLGSFANDLGTNAIDELTLLSGTFNAEYGNALSGIVNILTREGGRSWQARLESRAGSFQNSDENKAEGSLTSWSMGGPLLGEDLRLFVSGQLTDQNSYLPWGFNNSSSYTTKLTYTGISNVKINTLYRTSWRSYKNYSHSWAYIPEQYYHYKSARQHLNLNLTHTLNPHLFYELRISQYEQNYRQGIWIDSTATWKDSSAYSAYSDYDWNYEAGNGYEFYARRDPPTYTISATKTFDLRWDGIWQANTWNELKVGFQFKQHKLVLSNPYDPGRANPYRDEYNLIPIETAAYFQDKIEFPFLVINLGLRFDQFDGKVSFRANPLDESTRTTASPKNQFSPRLGIAHPISDRTKIHFAYGHFFQNPPYAYLYNRLNYDVTVSAPVFGDPDMDAEKTVAYEVGLTHQFSSAFLGRFNAFYKDISNLVGTRYYAPYAEDAPDRYVGYTLIINEDYAFSKGLEINLAYNPNKMVTTTLTYTFSIAKGSSSYADEQYPGSTETTTLYYLDFDRTHGLNVFGSIRTGERQGWTFFNTQPFAKTDFGFVFRANSGRPYTPSGRDIGLVEINSLRKPSTYSLDIVGGKRFSLAGKLSARVFLEVQNLTNARNAIIIFTTTGEPDYTLTPGHSEEYMNNPTHFGPPRTIRVGLALDWR
ncbi:MAG: TonB-dependent receptor [Candidatus Marinimicrobia bacterium]|nr:TonB-dependent receptor [Candidatus Neomarinimicrobiota bacterium]